MSNLKNPKILLAIKCTIAASMYVLKLTRDKYPHIKTMIYGENCQQRSGCIPKRI